MVKGRPHIAVDHGCNVGPLSRTESCFGKPGSSFLEKLKMGWGENGIHSWSGVRRMCCEVGQDNKVPLRNQNATPAGSRNKNISIWFWG